MNESAEREIEELSQRWHAESLRYVSSQHAFVERAQQSPFDYGGEEPQETRAPMADSVIAAVRHANTTGEIDVLRKRFPPAHSPFIERLDRDGQGIPVAILLDDGRILVRIGAPYEEGYVAIIDGLKVDKQSPDILTVGRSDNRRYFAVATQSGVTIHDGWEGPVIAQLPWPTGQEGLPDGFHVEPLDGPPVITQLIPFPEGDRALLTSPEGIFVLEQHRAIRLLPTPDQSRDYLEWARNEFPDDLHQQDLSMGHGAVSPNGKLIAAGHQSSEHYIFDAENYTLIGQVAPEISYPHYAAFNSDATIIAFNSCHFYGGVTLGIETECLPDLTLNYADDDQRITMLEDGSRVYATACRGDELIVGDAHGYLRAVDWRGNIRWQYLIGSTIGAIDISVDGKQLVATTYAGFVCLIDLDTGEPDPFTFTTATHREKRRWLFWKSEKNPLAW